MNDQANARTSTRFQAVLDQVVSTSRWMLLAFALLEVALPRAGRTAAGLLLRYDSDLLRWLEAAGSSARVFVANGLFFSACAVVLFVAARDLARAPLPAKGSVCVALAACGGILARAFDGEVLLLWSLVAACALLAAAALLWSPRRLPEALASVLETGVAAYAAWAIVVSLGKGAFPWIDAGSEILVFAGAGGAAWASALACPGAGARAAAGAASFATIAALAAFFREGFAHVLRHLLGAGNAGLPAAVSTGLVAFALSGLVAALGRGPVFVPVLVTAICARRPEPHLIAGVVAASALLAVLRPGAQARPRG